MAASKFQIKRKCPICGEEFMAKTIESFFCSPACSKVAWKRKHDEEERNKRLDEVVKTIRHGTIACVAWSSRMIDLLIFPLQNGLSMVPSRQFTFPSLLCLPKEDSLMQSCTREKHS